MSTTDGNTSVGGAAHEKLGEDDHDLLTFGEAGKRLRLKIAAAEAAIASLATSDTSAEPDKARTWVAALGAAAKRNAAQPINDPNFEKFFGYPGKGIRPGPAATDADTLQLSRVTRCGP